MSIEKLIARAIRMKAIHNGLVVCDNCDTPASASLSKAVSWAGCGPCITGESDSFDSGDLIAVPDIGERRRTAREDLCPF